MMTSTGNCSLICRPQSESSCASMKLRILKLPACNCKAKSLGFNITGVEMKTTFITPVRKTETSTTVHIIGKIRSSHQPGYNSNDEMSGNDFLGFSGKGIPLISTKGNSTNIVWHKCSVEKSDRQELLQQRGCVVWITGLSGSGKSTVACALGRGLHARGKLTYILDGDNVRHGLNRDLSFAAEDRAENIRRIGEVAKLFVDAGVICIASLISPYREERDACRALLPEGDFIEVFMDVPLHVCETRDPKGLYKLARAGKIKGFTGIDDPYEPPLKSEIVLRQNQGLCDSPNDLADVVMSYLDKKGYLKA
ncbi:adenylyl-sulfate kinase 3 [Solanum dulcamara]|uniref:adenylyl-sulfate kinase 3 n=1 Tax=Solanum dulcamara TaxID=45834 RepID=UPI0024858E1A|nr:adenylyl-sulfate kinase 3 [Solanum dulcamara]XP_055804023.1 adenylyl-sulfate kinase 3 [Solanum dulcamara]